MDDPSLYDHLDVNIQGKITLEVYVGEQVIKRDLTLYLELKPKFVSVNINSITPDADGDLYTLDVTVIHQGADYLYYELEQEFSSNLWTEFIREPYIANIHFSEIYMRGIAWLDIKLVNNYGSVKETIEIPRQDDTTNLPTISDVNSKKPDVKCYQAFDLQGQSILQTKEYSEITSLPHGVYIVKTIRVNGQIETQKIILK